MKKLTALLLAGVLSAGIISISACNPDSGSGEELVKIPQIPAGVTLNDVAFDKIEETAAKFNNSRGTSKNIRAEYYDHYKFTGYTDDRVTLLEDSESYSKAKYLDENGKKYGEASYHYYNHNLNNNHYVTDKDSGEVFDYEQIEEKGTTAFINDKIIGAIREAGKSKGHAIEKYPANNIDRESEWDEPSDKQIIGVDVNREEYNFSESNSGMLLMNNHAYGVYPVPWLVESACYRYCAYGTETHMLYTNTQDVINLIVNRDNEDAALNLIMVYDNFEVENYSFTMKADETKIYLNQEFKINVLGDDNTLYLTIEMAYVYYQDIESDLSVNDFKDNYLTDDLTSDFYYYDCDEQKVAADFTAGKQLSIEPVGGYDVSNLNYGYGDKNYNYLKPCIVFIGNDDYLPVAIAGEKNADFARVKNGKVIIDSADAFSYAKNVAQKQSFNLTNAKIFLIIYSNTPNTYLSTLYIPLN